MNHKVRNFLLRSVPYVMSLLCGVILYWVALNFITDRNLSDLIFSISGSLIGIPVVFLAYNYSNYKMNQKVNETLTVGLNFEINSWMLKMIKVLREVLKVHDKFEWKSIDKMLNSTNAFVKKRLKITKGDLGKLKTCKESLDQIIYGSNNLSLLPSNHLQILTGLSKELSHLINECEFRGNQLKMAEYTERIMDLMDDWFDAGEKQDFLQHKHYLLAVAQGDETISVN